MLRLIIIVGYLFCFNLIMSQEKDTPYKLCNEVKTFPYYNPELTYKGGFWEIKKHFKSTYPVKKFSICKMNTGIITIQFKVNCKGEAGEFKLKQCDLNYKPVILSKMITDYFLNQTKLLKNWIPAKDEEGNSVNSHKFFSFKIVSGHLIEILPK